MINERLEQQLTFLHEIDRLKNIVRRTRLFDGSRLENDAEHSWHLAMMVIVLAEHSNEKIDLSKVIKMVLIHDIVEIDTGDIFLYDTTKDHNNSEEEEIAAHRIFGLLPEDQYRDFLSAWKEFEERKTPEAKFARAIDRYAPTLQNLANKGGAWKEHKISAETIEGKNELIKDGSVNIWNKFKISLAEMLTKGFILK
jgi:putative hydrolases of HD superfamily